MNGVAWRAAIALVIGLAILVSSACGIGRSDPAPPTSPGPAPSLAQRIAATSATANASAGVCADIAPFYWEIGDGATVNGSGSVLKTGNATVYTATSEVPIDAASSWLYAAYVVERRRGALTAADVRFLTQRSGYTGVGAATCDALDTVEQCRARGSNGTLTAASVGRFVYDAGHLQTHASLPAPDMNLGALTAPALGDEMRRVLGTDIQFVYTQPLVATGVRTSAAQYGRFLRKLLRRELLIANLPDTSAVCTTGPTCATAEPNPWPSALSTTYSLGYWLGDIGPNGKGVLGFYPWIDATRKFYGIIARQDSTPTGLTSQLCGTRLWQAWVSGVAVR